MVLLVSLVPLAVTDTPALTSSSSSPRPASLAYWFSVSD
jgi:hypothetical protein